MKKRLLIITILIILFTGGCAVYDMFFTVTPQNALSNKNFSWKTDTSQHFNFHFVDSSYAAKNIKQIKISAENDISVILKLIEEPVYNKKTDYFLLNSTEKMYELIKHRSNALSYPRFNAVYAVYNDSIKAIGAHELNHVIVHNLWGSQGEKFLSEGFAVFSDNSWNGYNLHYLCKYLLKKGKLISLENLINNFSKYSSMLTYPQSGSFVKFLFETYGKEKFRKLWEKGSGSFNEIYNKDIKILEFEWLERIKYEADESINYPE